MWPLASWWKMDMNYKTQQFRTFKMPDCKMSLTGSSVPDWKSPRAEVHI